MTRYLNDTDLLTFLEESFNDKKDQIKSLNKYYERGNSFLSNTYHFIPVSINDDSQKYLAIIFEDLPSPYPDSIIEKIKSYMANNELKCEFQTWGTYQSYNNIN